jgi:enoyl-CoA hydratase
VFNSRLDWVRGQLVEESGLTAPATDSTGRPQDAAISTGIEGAAGIVTLDRPRALNALTTAMRAEISAAFAAWTRDPQVYAAVIVSATDRAFCAGGDVREMVEWGKARPADARRSLAAEYALNWQLECFTKPTVSLIDGTVMGSGVGITLYGTHRVAGERYRFAMPETGIGLFPDDGVSWAFARMPDEIGIYLALTGRAIGRADAYRLGLVTHCLPAARFAEVRAALGDADPVDPVLDSRHEDPGLGEIDALRPAIVRCFGQPSVEAIAAALAAERGESETWAKGALADLQRCSPTSLKVTLRHVRGVRGADLSATLKQDFRLASRFMQAHDFYEGVRAGLIDRDQAPKWQPGSLDQVSDAAVEAYFAPLGADELTLATRSEMQAVRS